MLCLELECGSEVGVFVVVMSLVRSEDVEEVVLGSSRQMTGDEPRMKE